MRVFLVSYIILFLFTSLGYTNQYSSEPENTPNEVEIDDEEEESKGNDVLGNDVFCDYSKAC